MTKKDSDSTSELFNNGDDIITGRPSDNEPNGTYNVVVTGGKREPRWKTTRSSNSSNGSKNIPGGITATTQVTQEVEISRST